MTKKTNAATTTINNNSSTTLPQHVLQRNRAVAEREASRLARPDRPQASILGHANRSKSAVSSTPFGFTGKRRSRRSKSDSRGDGKNDGDDDDDDDDGLYNNSNDWCGPFSVARQMIAQREEARRKRLQQLEEENDEYEENDEENNNNDKMNHPLDEMVQEAQLEKKRKAHPSMTWKPNTKFIQNQRNATTQDDINHGTTKTSSTSTNGKSNRKEVSNLYHKRQKRISQQEQSLYLQKVPSLFQTCIQYIVSNFEHVESLGGNYIDHTIRQQICKSLLGSGKMNGAAFDTLSEVGIETLDIVDCSMVTSDQMSETLQKLIPNGLKALILNHAGRCFTSKAVQAICNFSNHNDDSAADNDDNDDGIQLFALSIGGAYLLKDFDMAKLVAVSSHSLSSIQLKACPLIGLEFCNTLYTHYTMMSSSSLLELVLEDMASLTKEHFMILTNGGEGSNKNRNAPLRNLKNLSLKQIDTLDDEVIDALLSSITGNGTTCNLEAIDLSQNVHLTDATLSSIRRCNMHGKLKSLRLTGNINFTAAGLETFFTFDIQGLPNPPTLRTLDLSNCHNEAVNETVVNLAIAASSLKRQSKDGDGVGGKGIPNNHNDVSTMGGFISLDVSGSSITDTNMEQLAIQCRSSLQELKINFCTNVSNNGCGYLVSKVRRQLNRIEIWGCAQITEIFLDGHSRINDGELDIVGAWMAKR